MTEKKDGGERGRALDLIRRTHKKVKAGADSSEVRDYEGVIIKSPESWDQVLPISETIQRDVRKRKTTADAVVDTLFLEKKRVKVTAQKVTLLKLLPSKEVLMSNFQVLMLS